MTTMPHRIRQCAQRQPGRCGRLAILLAAIALSPHPLRAQQPIWPGTELDAYVRLLEISGSLQGSPLVFRPLSPNAIGTTLYADSAHPWHMHYLLARDSTIRRRLDIRPLPSSLYGVYQSAYPRSVNDGALWAGKGVSAEIQVGATARWGPLTATLYPTIWMSANADFETIPDTNANRSVFGYAWTPNIDWPQRFGTDAVTQFDWGQSEVRLDLGGFTAGFGTTNMWWGPAQRFPILMSNNAAGFPHVDLGTGRPIHLPWGRGETRFVWGQLRESAYFDTVPSNDRRLFVGLTAATELRWVPGLQLGAARLFYLPWDSVRAGDYFDVLQSVFKEAFSRPGNVLGDDYRDQMLSLFGRWALPKSGFEVYVEWSRNDHNWDIRDFLMEPDHSQAVMLGFTKAVTAGPSVWRLRGEVTNLERSRTLEVRASPPYYEHYIVQQGYTERGQLIGAAIGPGASSQFLGLDRYDHGGRLGIYLERVRYDNDVYYARIGPLQTFHAHDVELSLGLSALRFLGGFDWQGTVEFSRELNRYFELNNDKTNVRVELRVTRRWAHP